MGIVVEGVTWSNDVTALNETNLNAFRKTLFDAFNGNIENANIKSTAAIVFTKLEDLDRGKILIGNSSNEATETTASGDKKILIGDGTDLASVTVSGDITISNAGVVAIASDVIINADVKSDAAIVGSKLNLAAAGAIGGGTPATGAFTTLAASDQVTITHVANTTGLTVTADSVTNSNGILFSFDGLTNGTGFNVQSTNNTTGGQLASFAQLGASAEGVCVLLNHAGDGPHINFTGDPSNSTPSDGDLWFDGTVLKLRVGAATKTIDMT